MICSKDIWDIIQTKVPREDWVSLEEIYQLVEKHGNLDAEDFDPQSPTSDTPKWKRNVRNVLQYRKSTGEILVLAKFYGIERQGICYPKPDEGS